MNATPFRGAVAQLGECPRWRAAEQRVYWTDIDGRRLWRASLDGAALESCAVPQKVGCFAFRRSGGMVLAMEDGIYAADPFVSPGEVELLCELPDPELVAAGGRFNDGGCDPAGRLFVGTIDPARAGRAALYCLEPGAKSLRQVQPGFSTFNGLAFHPGGDQVWYSDTPAREVYRSSYDAGTGEFGPREVACSWPVEQEARPDGASFDTAGDYWCAMYAGGCVLRVSEAGEVKDKHEIPATYTTMAAFVGADLDAIVVTTGLREDNPQERSVNADAGCLFRLELPGLAGAPASDYAG